MAATIEKWTVDKVPDQHDQVAVVTGANTGIGFEVAKMLAARGARVVLAVRDAEKGRKAVAHIAKAFPESNVIIQQLDLASLASIRAAAKELHTRYPRIDLLINNAGTVCTPKRTTVDGFELQFGINHLGHFAFTGLLFKAMLAGPNSRIVTVSSMGHKFRAKINFDDLQGEHSYDPVSAYGQSKLANLMFTYELQRRLSAHNIKTISVAAHPGAARTNAIRNAPMTYRALICLMLPFGLVFAQSAAMGALSVLRAATDPNVQGGEYYGPDGRWPNEWAGYPKAVESSEQSYDAEAQSRLWKISEQLTGVEFPV